MEAQVLARCDGRTAAVEVVAGLDRPQDGYLLLERLVERELITWDAALPVGREAEEVLRTRIAGIGDLDVRREAAAGLARLCAAREAVAAAAGDAVALRGALAGLDAEFTALTGGVPRRRDGQMYAGRTLCYEDTARDLDVTVGTVLLDELAAPLEVILTTARWLTAELADAYATALRELHDDLREDTGDGPVSLADLMSLAQGLFWGEGRRPADDVAEDFTRRWESLFGLEQDSARVRLSAADLAEAVARLFPARRPGWSTARLHSPDLQICATDVEAINRGDYQVVLGELHAAWPTFDCDLFTVWHPEVHRLRDELSADVGEHRVRLLYPAAWPRQTGRVAASLTGVTDRLLGFAAAPGADPDRLLPATAVTVSDEDGELVATAPDGHRWPLIEMFAGMLNGLAVDAFKLALPVPHAPRITIDRLVIARETWRTTVAETGLAAVTDERERYLATRAWRARLGLPDRVFIKIGTEVKPCYSDLTSPHYVGVLCTMLRTAGDDASVTITEALPTPDQAWVPDHAGNRYFSELRLQITDPDTPGGVR
ncbi:lantibiotic dehydratase [Planomonospora parontospora]|uniref:lantibiotic dehydratase n=1 Tax=Planomonospora parontospora TaxID=58119 RepID=UPI003624483F